MFLDIDTCQPVPSPLPLLPLPPSEQPLISLLFCFACARAQKSVRLKNHRKNSRDKFTPSVYKASRHALAKANNSDPKRSAWNLILFVNRALIILKRVLILFRPELAFALSTVDDKASELNYRDCNQYR